MSDQEDIMADSEPITVASLFSGAGGLDIGFSENPAFEIALHLDVDETAVETLEANRGTYVDEEAVLLCEDVREVADAVLDDRPDEFNIPATLGDEIDFIIGGPPCQPFSAAARRAGGTEGTDSEEGRLFEAYVDLLDKWQPAGFLFENVSGVTSNEEDWEPIVEAFRGAGYVVEKPRTARTLNAADYGVPQHRARTFIVGVREDIDVDYHFPKPTHDEDSEGDLKSVTAGEALADLDNDDVEAETPYEVTS
ncbi:DNA cytosine methyltransferase, partial [Halorubrum sp. SP3]|uniref:DNA cytosine methyltransferase n=2 Tax=unclassified Halorubrum TaxID=2642239 RepID=UPI001F546DA1